MTNEAVMMKQPASAKIKFSLSLVLCLVACAKTNVKTQQVFNLSRAGMIELDIKGSVPNDSRNNILQTVKKNLTDWEYGVSEKQDEQATHLMSAEIGEVTYGSTPSGFSYSIGDSDPRALEFQKMDVLPIGCRLQSKADPAQNAELSMDFMADKSDKEFLNDSKLADHISTVCYNLLTQLKWPRIPHKSGRAEHTETHQWMPEIRIEEKAIPENPVTPSPPAPAVPQPANKTEPSRPSNSAVRVEPESRRRIIIHNQGSPVTLELGYERK